MALQFPSNPAAVGNIYEASNGTVYYYDGTKWSGHALPATVSVTEAAQDAIASLFLNGNQTGISVTYNDQSNFMDLEVLPTPTPIATSQQLGGVIVGHNLIVSSDGTLSTEPYVLDSDTPVYGGVVVDALDLSKQVFVMGPGTWQLIDGVEGQICYFTPQTGCTVQNSIIRVDKIRVIRNNIATIQTVVDWYPFDSAFGTQVDSAALVTAIFTDGAWSVSQGITS
jgi:hypothetical protein